MLNSKIARGGVGGGVGGGDILRSPHPLYKTLTNVGLHSDIRLKKYMPLCVSPPYHDCFC